MKTSVALCTFNGEKYIREQIQSILNQTYKVDEIVITDDGSTDNTIRIIQEVFSDSDIEYTLKINKVNIGVTKNFESVIMACSGDIIFMCDQDDIWLEDKVEQILNFFEINTQCEVVFTNAYLVDSSLNKFKKSLWDTVNYDSRQFNGKEDGLFNLLLNRNIATGATMAFRKSLIEKIVPIPNEWIHDGWIAIIAAINKNIYAYPERLILYRQHSNNVIGATNEGVIHKSRKYINKPEKILLDNQNKYKRYNSVLNYVLKNHLDISTNKLNNLRNCIYFWKDKSEITVKDKKRALAKIIKHISKGHYRKFATGYKAVIKDIFFYFSLSFKR